MRNYIRGGQMALHFYRMFNQLNGTVLKVAAIAFLLLSGFLIYKKTTAYERDIFKHYYFAECHQSISGSDAPYQFLDPEGRRVTLKVGHFLTHPSVQYYKARCIKALRVALIQSGSCTGLGIVLFVMALTVIGHLQKRQRILRGSAFLTAKALKKHLRKSDKASDIVIAKTPLLKDAEMQHILLSGTTGTGKSLYILELMDNIRRRGERAIVYDIAGTFVQHFYREKKDIILNPFDKACPVWNIWQDGEDLADFEAMAASLMPLHLSGNDPFWINSARTIFSTLAEKLRQMNTPYTRSLLQPMFSSDLGHINQLLKGTVAETLVNPSVEKMALSIKSTLSTYCKALLYLKAEGQEPLFSIKKWIRQEKQDGWIFITSSAEKMEALKPLISVWLDTAARAILSLEPSRERRIWLLIDELASLHKLPSLSLLLSQGRKYGLCAASAFQDIHQIRTIYGMDEAQALLAMYNTHILFRTKCPHTAQWMSHLTGQRESIEQREGFSYGANTVRDGVSIQSERRQEPLILPTEFLRLNDKEAYMVLPGDEPISKITLKFRQRKILSASRVLTVIKTLPAETEAPSKKTDADLSLAEDKEKLPKKVEPSIKEASSKPLDQSAKKRNKKSKKSKKKTTFKEFDKFNMGR